MQAEFDADERTAESRLADPARLAAVVSTGLLDTGSEPVFDDLAALAAQLTGLPLAFITFVDADRSYWKATVGTGIAASDVLTRQNAVSESFCQYVITRDGPVVIPDALGDPVCRDNPAVAGMGVRAWAGYPVRDPDGHVLGSFCVVDTAPRTFSAQDLTVLETLASAASREVALRAALRAAADFSAQASSANYRLLVQAQASDRLNATLEPARILSTLTEMIVPEFGVWVAIAMPAAIAREASPHSTDDDPRRVVVVEYCHRDRERTRALRPLLREFPFSTEDSVGLGRAITTAQTLHRTDLSFDSLNFPLAGGRDITWLMQVVSDVDSVLTLSLRNGPHVFGAVSIGMPAGAEIERELLADLTRRAGAALDNALTHDRQQRTGDELQRRARRHELLARASAALHRQLEPMEELRELARATVPELADLSTVHVLARPVPAGTMPPLPVITTRVAAETIAGIEVPPEAEGLKWTGDGDPITSTIAHGRLLRRPIATPSVPSWAETTGTAETFRTGLRQLVLAPVIVDGLVIAVASFGMCHDRKPWDEDDLDALQEIARYAGIALGHGLAFQRTRATALALQRSLLNAPPDVPDLQICAVYQPAGRDEIGGDWHDVFALDNGELSLTVGDVVGHDIAAAAAMGQLRAALRAIVVADQPGAGEALARLATVNQRLGITSFATVIHGRMRRDATHWTFRWANAGHPEPLLLTPDGQVQVLSTPRGIALNEHVHGTYADGEVALPPGSTLLVYTDGLIEQRDVDIEASVAALAARVARCSGRDLNDLCADLLSGASGADDLALLAIRNGGSRSRLPHAEPNVLTVRSTRDTPGFAEPIDQP